MRWGSETEAIEAALERIWDLHDEISAAILAISRSQFLRSIKTLAKSKVHSFPGDDPLAGAFVERNAASRFDFGADLAAPPPESGAGGDAEFAEARSLDAIRSALENLEDQLECFHAVHSQQQADRGAALERLENSRINLAMKLAEHHGKKYKVIEDALAFVGNVHDKQHFIAPEDIMRGSQSGEDLCKNAGALLQTLMSSLNTVKNSMKLENMGSLFGNAALFAISMLVLLKLQQVDRRHEKAQLHDSSIFKKKNINSRGQIQHFDVMSARG